MKLLFTGASGFLGTNILPTLCERYKVSTVGLAIDDEYQIDLSKSVPDFLNTYDIILHAAGKAHSIPKTKNEEQVFYDVNLQGTKNLCAALEKSGIPNAFIFISTVAVYGCDFGDNITEEHPLNGHTPYALSKIQAEQYLVEWCEKHHVCLSIIRPSLIAGPNPPGNLGAMIKGIKSGKYLSINCGKAKKSVLMVQDIANLIPLLLKKGGIYNVCDSYHPSFGELELLISGQLKKRKPFSIPYWIAKLIALIGDYCGSKAPINSLKLKKINYSLTFSNKKAKEELLWIPINILDNFKIDS